MNDPKIVFMGTPKFAVGILDKLLHKGFNIDAVVTAPDKMGGRGKNQSIISEVKNYALSKNLNILQPTNLKSPEFVQQIRDINPDFIIVVAFRMLPQIVWSIPKYGTINLHGSLLPKFRGAAPIQWAIIKGEEFTGVTTFYIDENIDCGEILLSEKIKIEESDDSSTLHDKLMLTGARVMVDTINGILEGIIKPEAQNQNEVTYAPKIFRDTCKINFDQKTKDVYNFIRGLSPHPGAWTIVNGNILKIFKVLPFYKSHTKLSGLIETDGKNILRIYAFDGWIEIIELQMEGKKRMMTKDFLLGNQGPFQLS